jgi:hypothetical protein
MPVRLADTACWLLYPPSMRRAGAGAFGFLRDSMLGPATIAAPGKELVAWG